MAQMKVGSFSSSGAAENISIGFSVGMINIYNSTAGGVFSWNSSMADGSYFDYSDGSYTSSNGVTPLSQGAIIGPAISAISKGADTTVTASYLDQFSIIAGYTVNLVGVADDLSGTTLNLVGASVKSVTSTTIVLEDSTASGYSVYVSGGYIVPVSDENGDPVATVNAGINGLTLGTGVVGSESDAITYVAFGENPVV